MEAEVLIFAISHIKKRRHRRFRPIHNLNLIPLLIKPKNIKSKTTQKHERQSLHHQNRNKRRRVMSRLLGRLNRYGCNPIRHAIRTPDQARSDGFLGMAGCVCGHESEDHDEGCSEDGHDEKAPEGDGFGVDPVRAPDDGGACDDGEAAEHGN